MKTRKGYGRALALARELEAIAKDWSELLEEPALAHKLEHHAVAITALAIQVKERGKGRRKSHADLMRRRPMKRVGFRSTRRSA